MVKRWLGPLALLAYISKNRAHHLAATAKLTLQISHAPAYISLNTIVISDHEILISADWIMIEVVVI